MLTGAWKSYYDLEDNLTLNELIELYGAVVDKENQDFKRAASIQGIDLDKNPGADDEAARNQRFREFVARKKGKVTLETESLPGTGYMRL